MNAAVRVLILNATLKASHDASSTEALAQALVEHFPADDCEVSTVRVVDLNLLPGISADLGPEDEWPSLRQRILDSEIVVFATPTWLGSMTSVMRRVLERMNADISTTRSDGRPLFSGRVAAALVVGNEDGAHSITADLFQAVNDLGFTVPAHGGTYWNGRAREKVDFLDLESTPDSVREVNETLARNALHLARILRSNPYPAPKA